jgi:hypothetical protein
MQIVKMVFRSCGNWLRREAAGLRVVLFAVLLTWGGGAFATSISFCVDCPAGSSIGLPVGIGHGFVKLMPMNNAQAGQSLGYGLYPATYDIFGGAGIIKNDSTRRSDFCITYNVTPAQYNAAVAVISAAITAPPAYNMGTNNCVDFINSVAAAAGITLPNTATSIPLDGSVSDPAAMWNSLSGIGNGGTFGSGTVMTTGGMVAVNTPNDFSYAGLTNDGHDDASNVASYTGLPFDQVNLGALTANDLTGITINLTNPDLSASITSVDWGDGSPYPGQQSSFSHVYGAPGTYDADLFVMDSGAVHSYPMSISVSSSPASSVDVTITGFSPATDENPGFGPPDTPLAEVPEPAGITLATLGLIASLGLVTARRRRVDVRVGT